MRLYEQAIQSARANGFAHNEALANELAGRFFLGRGLQRIGLTQLHEARTRYAFWGADGKVKQLDQRYPQLTAQQTRFARREQSASSWMPRRWSRLHRRCRVKSSCPS